MTTTVDVPRALRVSHRVIASHQAATGAYPACEEFSAYRGYCWFRDGAFIADAMSRIGDKASATRFHDWADAVLRAHAQQVDHLMTTATPDVSDMMPTRFTLDGEPGADPWWDFQLDGYGTWLWAVHQHATRHGLDVARWGVGITVAARYLTRFWDMPCYDWWEEHVDQRHGSTLGAIHAGLTAAGGSAAVDAGLRGAAARAAKDVRAKLLSDGLTPGGYLSKWVGQDGVDGSLAACVVPFGVVAPGSAVAEATLAKIEADLCVGGGVHRFVGDVFFGGGQWPLLTCLLGWNQAAAGRRDRAIELLTWAIAQADRVGQVPEQVDANLLHPQSRAEWVSKWGPVAKPLLWSHAMIITLATELGFTP